MARQVSARDRSTQAKNHNDKWFYERSLIFSGALSSVMENFPLLTSFNFLVNVMFGFFTLSCSFFRILVLILLIYFYSLQVKAMLSLSNSILLSLLDNSFILLL